MDVPANADLTINYWDGDSWETLAGPIVGPSQGYTYTPSAAEQDEIQGIQFVFTPKEGETLPPGFHVSPNFTVEVRDQKRDGTPIEDPDGQTYVVANDAGSEVHNDDAVVPTQDDTASDDVELRPTEPGPGTDAIDKVWLDAGGAETDNADYIALSSGVHTARIKWGTAGIAFDQVQVVDDPAYDDIATSMYDAFDLVQVRPITPGAAPANDPYIADDTVASVELYRDGQWVEAENDPCPDQCVGSFPGYQLTADEQADTLAVRLTFEGTTGSVTPSFEIDRPIDLDFRVRDTLRSDPATYVLGTSHPGAIYNNGAAGLVDNTAQVSGTRGGQTFSRSDDVTATIIDRPLDVSVTKEFDQDQLGLPQTGTPADQYPLITATLTATNQTAAKVAQMGVSDPSSTQPDPTAYDVLNLYDIGPITLPLAATQAQSYVELTREGGGVDPRSRSATPTPSAPTTSPTSSGFGWSSAVTASASWPGSPARSTSPTSCVRPSAAVGPSRRPGVTRSST